MSRRGRLHTLANGKVVHVGGRSRPTKTRATHPHLFKSLMGYVKCDVPDVPDFDYTTTNDAALADILGNDSLGDCTSAGAAHIIDAMTGMAGSPVAITRDQAIAFYSKSTGYDPGNPNSDQGGDEVTVCQTWKDQGYLADGSHKILGWATIEDFDPKFVKWVGSLFPLYFGIELADSWMNAPVWDVGNPPDPNDGHCFTGDTKVSLLDGREMSFVDLAAGVAGDSFGVYSCDHAGNVVAGRAHSVRLTRRDAALVKVTLDNGETIRCTPDHLFLLRDGTYRAAIDLTPDESLMPLYRRENDAGYEEFMNPRTGGWRSTHRTVAFGEGCRTDGMVAHHWDFNKRNNAPENLKVMTPEAHTRLHQETAAVLKKYAQSERGRDKSRDLMSALWADPEWRAKMDAALMERTAAGGRACADAGGGFRGMSPDILRDFTSANGRRSIARLNSAENQKKAANGLRRRLAEDPVFRAEHAARARANIAKANAAASPNNHKVVSVEADGRADVYDLTVGEHHNFALSAGVFVHNCVVGLGGNAQGIVVDTWGQKRLITYAAIAQFCADSAGGNLFAILTEDGLNAATNLTPGGVDWATLQADLANLGGTTNSPDFPSVGP